MIEQFKNPQIQVVSMEEGQHSEVLRIASSSEFDCFKCIYYLSLHGNNLGVQHYLVNKLATFPYPELEFYIPQLIQIVISFESDSMALRDFILDNSRKYPHFCLISFWNLQAYVFELKNEPESYLFHEVRNFINSLQNIMFNQDSSKDDGIYLRENLHPALMMCASMAASIGLPQIHSYAEPLIISQGRQQKSFLFKLANFHKSLTRNLTLKNRGQPIDLGDSGHESGEESEDTHIPQRYSESILLSGRRPSRNSSTFKTESEDDFHYSSDYTSETNPARGIHTKRIRVSRVKSSNQWGGQLHKDMKSRLSEEPLSSHSMPDLVKREPSLDDLTISPVASDCSSVSLSSLVTKTQRNLRLLSQDDRSNALRVNYFKKETEFMIILQNISSRLSQVPKEARLTSLRAELSIVNGIFPSQIDIPQLLPLTSSPNKKYHRILKLNINEACVLNSAERVPYLLLIEYLSEDMDFDPSSEKNDTFLLASNSKSTFTSDTNTSASSPNLDKVIGRDTFEEADLGDISVIALSNQQVHFLNHLRARMSRDLNLDNRGSKRGLPLESKFSLQNENISKSQESLVASVKTKDLSAQIRIAAVMLKQLEKSGQANSEQSTAIKDRIINSMKALQDEFESIDYQQIREISAVHAGNEEQDAGERKLENDFKIGEDWATKKARIRKTSPYGHLPHWDLCSVIVKNGDDLQQEAFACQLIAIISNIWRNDNVGVWTKNMKIVVTSSNSGLVETINNAISVHSIKKTMTELSVKSGENPRGVVASIKDYLLKVFGDESSIKYKAAQRNFAKSLAAYSIICYVLQIKDRHNGNIMLDNEGHIIHIDFGFMLSNSPGSVGFEAAPFKLSMEYVDVLGGLQSPSFELFTNLCKEAFLSLRRNRENLISLVDMMQKDSTLPCFKNGPQTSVLLKQRLQLDLNEEECNSFVEATLIGKSLGSMYTRLYDQFQLLTQGIYS